MIPSRTPDADADEVHDALIGRAAAIPVGEAVRFLSVSPIKIPRAERPTPLQLRVSAPVSGNWLPVVLVSHGGGTTNHLSSLRGLSPLTDFWAARGFVVIQPSHLSSRSLGLPPLAPNPPEYWESRVRDLTDALEHLDLVENAIPGLSGRVDHDRIAVAGHSMGGQTASMLLGAQFTDEDGTIVRPIDERVSAGVLLAPTGAGPDGLTEVAQRYTCLRTSDFTQMTTPTLTIVGDRDESPEPSTRGPAYHADPYTDGLSPKALITLTGGEHMLGGITGYDASEATDPDPERAAVVQRMSWAYLASHLRSDDAAWDRACRAFAELTPLGRVESK